MHKLFALIPTVVKSAVVRKLVERAITDAADTLADALITRKLIDADDKSTFSAHLATDATALLFRYIDKAA